MITSICKYLHTYDWIKNWTESIVTICHLSVPQRDKVRALFWRHLRSLYHLFIFIFSSFSAFLSPEVVYSKPVISTVTNYTCAHLYIMMSLYFNMYPNYISTFSNNDYVSRCLKYSCICTSKILLMLSWFTYKLNKNQENSKN